MKHLFLQSLIILGFASSLSAREPFVFQIQDDADNVLFSHDASFADLIDCLGERVDHGHPFTLAMDVTGPLVLIKVSQNGNPPRDYYSPITPQERGDLSELVRTLANESLLSLPSKESHLKRIGDRIVHLHPLKFLTIIFTDNELKVCMRNMEGKAWVWKKFQGETVESLAKEGKAGNLKQEMINDFASKVGISSGELAPYIQNQRWEQLISFLIAKVKVEKPQGKKYDM